MMRLRLAFALLAGCLAPAAAPAQTVAPACVRGAPPPAFTLDFAVTAARPPLRLNGSNRLDYSAADGRYTLRSVLDAGGLYSARQESSGNVDSAGWRPQRYEETTTRRGTSSASIDWTAQRVTFSGNEAPADAPAGLQDRLSILLHLGREQARRPKTSGYDLPIVGPRHVSRYRIEVQGRERIEVPYGRFETVRTGAAARRRRRPARSLARARVVLAAGAAALRRGEADDRAAAVGGALRAAALVHR